MRDFIEGPRIIRPIFAHNVTELALNARNSSSSSEASNRTPSNTGREGSGVLLYRRYISGSTELDVLLTPGDAATTLQALPDGNVSISSSAGGPRYV